MHEIPTTPRTTYLRGLLQHHGRLSLPLGSGLSFSLLEIFQPLRLRQSASDEKQSSKHDDHATQYDEAEHDEEADEDDAVVLVENGVEALNKSPRGRIVILGSPGTGKTTVLKHLLYHQAQSALEQNDAPLPIFLSLPDLAQMGQDLDAYLAHVASSMGLDADYAQTLAQAIQRGQAFVCLDSLDEVLPRLRPGIIQQINQLAQVSGNTWIVGSRFTDYKGGQFQQGQFQEWELQPLDHGRRLKLAAQLLPELQRQLAIDTNPDPYRYVQQLSEHQQAASWGNNPLLFSLGAVVYLRRGSLQGSRAMLYREVITALLETRGGDPQLQHILGQIALKLYQIKGRTFSATDLQSILTSLNVTQQASWTIAEMQYQVLNSGLLDVVLTDTYSFRHQTFQEYLVASALAEDFMSQDGQTHELAYQLAWSKHTYSRWNEVERLLVGILVQDYGKAGIQQAQAWLTRLLQQRHSFEGDPGNLSLKLAITMLGEVAQLQQWQTLETLALEELTATAWSEELNNFIARTNSERTNEHYWIITVNIGHLRPTAQQKIIKPLLARLAEGDQYHLGEIIGAIRSSYLTQYLLEALKRSPNVQYQRSIKRIFRYLGEFAPIDFLLAELHSQDNADVSNAATALIELIPYVPIEKIVPVLQLHGFGRPHVAENILLKSVGIKELPVPELLNVLHTGSEEASLHAACILAAIQHPAAIDPLLAHLNDVQDAKRKKALRALGNYATLPQLDKIIALLEDDVSLIRQQAIEVLAQFGSAVPLDIFIQAANNQDVGIRHKAMAILARFGSAVPLAIFIRAANDHDERVRKRAIEGLSQLGDQAPLDVLIQATRDPNRGVAATAIFALATFDDRIQPELWLDLLKQPHLIGPTLKALQVKKMVSHTLIQPLLELYEQNWQADGEIMEVLDNIGYPLTDIYLTNQPSTSWPIGRRMAVNWLQGQPATHELITERLEQLGDRCYPPYTRAINILANWPERHATDMLVQALANEDWRLSDESASALCKRADECTLEGLLPLLTHKHAWARKNALQVLTEHTNLPVTAPLIATLHDQNHQVREVAAKMFRKLGADAPLEALLAATLDDHIEVRREAAITLSQIGQRNPTLAMAGTINWLKHERPIEEEWHGNRHEEAWNTFVELSSFVPVELLLQAMYDLSEICPRCVAYALGQMGDQAPIAQLTLALQDNNQDIQQAAAFALSMTGERAPVPELIKALNTTNSAMRQEVIDTLVKISMHGNVPDAIFLQKIFKRHNYQTYAPLFESFTTQKKRIPDAIVTDVLEHSQLKTSTILQYLSHFSEPLPTFPVKLIVERLALNHRYRYMDEPNMAETTRQLLTKLSVDSLLETLTHRDSNIRAGGLGLLAIYPKAIPLEPILTALHDLNSEVRGAAIECLQKRPEELPIQAIIDRLQDSNQSVRIDAIKVLASLDDHAPLADLIKMLDVPALDVRSATIRALAQPSLREQVPTKKFIDALGEEQSDNEDDDEKQIVLEALYSKDPQLAINHAIASLGDSNNNFALFAFHFLERTHPTIIPEIIQEATTLFQDGKPGRFFRTLSMGFLAETLGEIEQTAPPLIAQLGDLLDWPYWEVRMKAAQALGKLRRNIPDATIRRLLDLRHDPRSRAVREAADRALAEFSLETGIEDD